MAPEVRCTAGTDPTPTAAHNPTAALWAISRSSPKQLVQPQIPPGGLLLALRRALDAKRGVLVGHHVVLVLGVDGLQVRGDVDVFGRELRGREVGKLLEEVGVVRVVHVQPGRCRVASLQRLSRACAMR